MGGNYYQSWVAEMFVAISGYRIGGKCINQSSVWSGQAMITLKELLDVYHQIYTERDPFWQEQTEQPYYLLKSIEALIHTAVLYDRTGAKAQKSEEQSIMSYCLDLICTYLVELQSQTALSDGQQTRDVIKSLNSVKLLLEQHGI